MILDASAIIEILKENKLELFLNSKTISLAIYESCNAIWKEVRKTKTLSIDEAKILIKQIKLAAEILEIYEVESFFPYLNDILITSIEYDHPTYDTFYMLFAKIKNEPLVTSDEDIIKKFRESIRVLRTKDVLNDEGTRY